MRSRDDVHDRARRRSRHRSCRRRRRSARDRIQRLRQHARAPRGGRHHADAGYQHVDFVRSKSVVTNVGVRGCRIHPLDNRCDFDTGGGGDQDAHRSSLPRETFQTSVLRMACSCRHLRSGRPGPAAGCRSISPRRSGSRGRLTRASQPGRSRIVAFFTFFPHHDAKITSGSRRATSVGSTMRSRASAGVRRAPETAERRRRSSTSSSTQRMPGDERVVPLFEERPQPLRKCWRLTADAIEVGRRIRSASRSAASWHPTRPPSIAIICRISATVRWLNVTTVRPRRTSSAHEVGLQVGERQHEVRLAAPRSCRTSR